ncbi:squalene synthetase-like protein [Bonamia ostreae]|uniref:Squalene synthetase-like protein n=1 Tax=Bonamia ostreae TaxID=126728 RepID=A0ABV2AE81_9EUKA
MIIESIAKQLRLDEFIALLCLRWNHSRHRRAPLADSADMSDEEFCFAALARTSRSFAIVIGALGPELRIAVGVYYLLLRALDTVEDDSDCGDEKRRLRLLGDFHRLIEDSEFVINGFGSEDERFLCENLDKVLRVFHKLPRAYRMVIKQTAEEMGSGMIKFSNVVHVESIAQYNEYTHYVAGILGEGLTKLFILSGSENRFQIGDYKSTSNSMGLFLQKTNIIRDFKEDLEEGRNWWPKEIWGGHFDRLEEFAKKPGSTESLKCLNEMVCDAIAHFPDCSEYLSKLSDRKVFRFCAIPQIMALSTLELMYSNSEVFEKSVKLRRGYTAKVFTKLLSYDDFQEIAVVCCNKLLAKMKWSRLGEDRAHVKKVESAIRRLEKLVSGWKNINTKSSWSFLDVAEMGALALFLIWKL